jgi:hypothetical protein
MSVLTRFGASRSLARRIGASLEFIKHRLSELEGNTGHVVPISPIEANLADRHADLTNVEGLEKAGLLTKKPSSRQKATTPNSTTTREVESQLMETLLWLD